MVEMSFPFEENVLVERGQFGIMDNFPVTDISEMTEITETTDQMDRLSHPDWIPLLLLYHQFCSATGVKLQVVQNLATYSTQTPLLFCFPFYQSKLCKSWD